ncbi:MAG: CHAP domain-containing protein, partial [Clostridia bacterium]|nr:CHAP domain-containing protein [Clostridia bacterium]
MAKTQIGYTELSTVTGKPLVPGQDGGYTKYGAWFGMPTVAWCAFFVAWCSNQAGISTDVIPRMGNCAALAQWFQARDRYFKRGELKPRTGDLIFYNWAGGSNQKHIGIVTGVSNGYVYTVEGNTGSKQGYRAEVKSRSVNAGYIVGYARPDYNDALTFVGSFSFAQYAAQKYKFAASRSGSVNTQSYRRTSTLSVATSAATDVTASGALLNGRIDNLSSYPVTQAGFYFGENKDSLSKIRTLRYSAKKSIELECSISDYIGKLEMLKTYYYRAYAVVNGTTYKGPVYSVTTVDDRPKMMILSENTISLSPGETYELLCAVLPLEARDDGIKWSVSDNDIIEVNDGIIKAKKIGSAVIRAESNYGNVSAECNVTVTLPEITEIKSENISENKIKLLWQAENHPLLSGFEIYRSEFPDDDFTLIKTTDKDTYNYIDNSVEAGNCYYYKIRAVAQKEDFSSPLSTPHREKALPAVPKIESIIQNGDTLRLEISGIDENNSYTVYRST